MSHYSLLVLGYTDEKELSKRMAPYDENLETESHICMSESELLKHYYSYHYENHETFYDYLDSLKKLYPFDIDNNMLSTCNPDAHWDYYGVLQVGRVKDFTGWEPRIFSAHEITEQRRRFEDITKRNADSFYIGFAGMTPEEYLANMAVSRSTYAVLTQSGEWIEPGKVGPFGLSAATPDERIDWTLNFYTRFIKDLDPESLVAFVDVHI